MKKVLLGVFLALVLSLGLCAVGCGPTKEEKAWKNAFDTANYLNSSFTSVHYTIDEQTKAETSEMVCLDMFDGNNYYQKLAISFGEDMTLNSERYIDSSNDYYCSYETGEEPVWYNDKDDVTPVDSFLKDVMRTVNFAEYYDSFTLENGVYVAKDVSLAIESEIEGLSIVATNVQLTLKEGKIHSVVAYFTYTELDDGQTTTSYRKLEMTGFDHGTTSVEIPQEVINGARVEEDEWQSAFEVANYINSSFTCTMRDTDSEGVEEQEGVLTINYNFDENKHYLKMSVSYEDETFCGEHYIDSTVDPSKSYYCTYLLGEELVWYIGTSSSTSEVLNKFITGFDFSEHYDSFTFKNGVYVAKDVAIKVKNDDTEIATDVEITLKEGKIHSVSVYYTDVVVKDSETTTYYYKIEMMGFDYGTTTVEIPQQVLDTAVVKPEN